MIMRTPENSDKRVFIFFVILLASKKGEAIE